MLRQKRAFSTALLPFLLGALVTSGCKTIHLNRAMERLHRHYLNLFYQVENDDAVAILTAADGLSGALDDPAITGYSLDGRFQEYIQDAQRVVAGFLLEPESLKPKRARALRKQLSESCRACHLSFRR